MAGASADDAACDENEALITAIGTRIAEVRDMSFFLLADLNI